MDITPSQLSGAALMCMVILMLIIWMLKIVRAFRAVNLLSLRQVVSSRLGSLTLLFVPGKSAETAEEVFKCVNSRRMDCSRVMASTFLLVVPVVSANLAVRLMTTAADDTSNGLGLTCFAVMLTLLHACPLVFFKPAYLAILHIAIMAIIAASALNDTDRETALVDQIARFIAALLIGGLYVWSPLILVTNSVFVTCSIIGKLRIFADSPNLRIIIILDLVLGLSIAALFIYLELISFFSAIKEVEQRRGKCELSAVSSLLDMMCDALVHLDSDMVISEHSPKLAAMLMHGARQSLEGKAFSTLIPVGDDAVRFESIASTCKVANEALPEPSLNSLRLRDAIGNRVLVTVFHVPYRLIGGQVHHIMGIREDSGNGGVGENLGGLNLGNSCSQEGSMCGPRVPAARLRPDLAEVLGRGDLTASNFKAVADSHMPFQSSGGGGGGGNISSSHSSNGSAGSGALRVDKPDPRMAVNVFLESMLPIHAVAPHLQRELYFEASEIPRLGALMPDGGETLLSRALNAVNDKMRHSGPGTYPIDLGDFEIRTKHAATSEELCTRKIWLDFAVHPSDDQAEDPSVDITPTEPAVVASKAIASEESRPSPAMAATLVISRGARRSSHAAKQPLRGTSAVASNSRESLDGCERGMVGPELSRRVFATHLKL